VLLSKNILFLGVPYFLSWATVTVGLFDCSTNSDSARGWDGLTHYSPSCIEPTVVQLDITLIPVFVAGVRLGWS